jgi:hypothetical protein
MWVWVTFAYLIPAVAITVQILSASNTQSQGSIRTAQHIAAGQSRNGAKVL